MTQTTLPKYPELQHSLDALGLTLHPSEIHGIICGIICSNKKDGINHWEILLVDDDHKQREAILALLHELYAISARLLNEFLFEFQLILPSDNDTLSMRTEALTLWCQGFLTGLQHAHVPIHHNSNPELAEPLDDLVEIAKINYEVVVDNEEDENAFVELAEYVRMAVIDVYQELYKNLTASPISSQLH